MKSEEYKRGYEAGRREVLEMLAGLREAKRKIEERRAREPYRVRLGGPDSRFKPRGIPGSIYNTPEDEAAFYNLAIPFGAVD